MTRPDTNDAPNRPPLADRIAAAQEKIAEHGQYIDHPDAPFDPHALAVLGAAKALLAEVGDLAAERSWSRWIHDEVLAFRSETPAHEGHGRVRAWLATQEGSPADGWAAQVRALLADRDAAAEQADNLAGMVQRVRSLAAHYRGTGWSEKTRAGGHAFCLEGSCGTCIAETIDHALEEPAPDGPVCHRLDPENATCSPDDCPCNSAPAGGAS